MLLSSYLTSLSLSSSIFVEMTLKLNFSVASSRNGFTNLTEKSGMTSSAPDDTLLTVGVRPHASYLLTMTPSTPMKNADLSMLPKF